MAVSLSYRLLSSILRRSVSLPMLQEQFQGLTLLRNCIPVPQTKPCTRNTLYSNEEKIFSADFLHVGKHSFQSLGCLRLFSVTAILSAQETEDLMKELEAETITNRRRKLSPNDVMINVGKLVPHKVLNLTDEAGVVHKAISAAKAVSLSQERDLKLVLVNQFTKPLPTYKLMTGSELHEEQKKFNEQKKAKAGPTVVKDVKLSASIGSNDLNVKRKHISEWLSKEKNIQIRVSVIQKRGVQLSKEDLVAIVHRLIDQLETPLVFNNEPKLSGKNSQNLSVVLRPMSVKEKARVNKEHNLMEKMKSSDHLIKENSGE
ncbi:Translation initiation factor IF-3, mitochondrial [Holothuria leucospilota]|uniref:Translation initiation factor IF-3, mitochondrial n=1 Tax=Holothuria leucospilota TaxID=206669 RepID=A0A9Q1BLG2_HOLLE|nr:Translation initiation factor IF-3, mitochondrial [Holothuria leucospilota]